VFQFSLISKRRGKSAMTLQSEAKSQVNEMDSLLEKIDLITKHQKPYIVNSLKRMAEKSACNVKVTS
jgi:hypothetical protein